MKPKRLTKNIGKKQSYCEFELKNCKYQDIYDFEKYSELEDNVDCELTLGIDKLGHYEDVEEEVGFSLIDLFTKKSVFVKNREGKICEYEFGSITNTEVAKPLDGRGGTYTRPDSFTNETYLDLKERCIRIIHIWDYEIMDTEEHYFKNYGKTWAFTKEELL